MLFNTCNEKETTESGVAFVVDRSVKWKVLDFKAAGDRICNFRIKTKFLNLSFVNVHAPTEEKKAF
jgi:hypothetical protein